LPLHFATFTSFAIKHRICIVARLLVLGRRLFARKLRSCSTTGQPGYGLAVCCNTRRFVCCHCDYFLLVLLRSWRSHVSFVRSRGVAARDSIYGLSFSLLLPHLLTDHCAVSPAPPFTGYHGLRTARSSLHCPSGFYVTPATPSSTHHLLLHFLHTPAHNALAWTAYAPALAPLTSRLGTSLHLTLLLRLLPVPATAPRRLRLPPRAYAAPSIIDAQDTSRTRANAPLLTTRASRALRQRSRVSHVARITLALNAICLALHLYSRLCFDVTVVAVLRARAAAIA